MTSPDLRIAVLSSQAPECLPLAGPWGPFAISVVSDEVALTALLAGSRFDALLLDAQVLGNAEQGLPRLESWVHRWAPDVATVVLTDFADPVFTVELLRLGVQDLLSPRQVNDAELAWRLRAAIERKAIEREARKAYSTDLGTGLPHQQQLVEHMSHLLALREREPSPMAVLVLRIEGFATVDARYGREAANVLRRKVAVRLRAGVRASDVVAAIGDDCFGVLLAAMLSPADAQLVGEKLLTSLHAPFKVTGHEVAVAAALGVARCPEDGAQPDALLHRAIGLAASATAVGRAGMANYSEGGPAEAANDD